MHYIYVKMLHMQVCTLLEILKMVSFKAFFSPFLPKHIDFHINWLLT